MTIFPSRAAGQRTREQPASPAGLAALQPRPWRAMVSCGLLAAVTVAWSAVPVSQSGAGTRLALITAICCAAGSLVQLAVVVLRVPDPGRYTFLDRRGADILAITRAVPWAEGLTVAVLALEALHPARPWHTGLLGVALVGYLLAVHLTETVARPGALRRQLPLLAAGTGLLAIAVGAAALPGLPAGPASAAIRVAAAIAAVIAAGLAVPIWTSRQS